MRRSLAICLLAASLCSSSVWAAFPGLRYLGDLGVLSSFAFPPTSVQLGKFRAVWSEDHFRFEGRDDDGKNWTADLEAAGGLGYSGVWQADFDHNSRQDLLIAQISPKNGRCTIPVTLSFLMFDGHGRPIPWVINAQAPSLDVPMIIADLNHNGRAEVVVADCVYQAPPSLGTDLRLTGIYEAKDAGWSTQRPARLNEYISLVRRRYRRKDVLDVSWPDLGNRPTEQGVPFEVTRLMKASEDCRGIRFPPIVNGQIMDRSQWKDPCDELGKNRIALSDGTICYGWPTVMVDDVGGREIVAGSEHPELLLQRVIEQRHRVILMGQREATRCSPVLLWALME